MLTAIPCTVMRGGTSKALFFHPRDLPAEREARDQVLLAALGSPDARQIDGMGGAHPLTSKVALVSRSAREGADVDYLFLQVAVDRAEVSDSQNCGNILAAVGPWALEQSLIEASGETTAVRIHMVNTGALAVAHVRTSGGTVEYEGDERIGGVPGSAAPIAVDFPDIAGSSCGAFLPTGAACDEVDGIEVTCIDNGMPVVILRAADVDKSGDETPAALEADEPLKARIERIRLAMGPRMNLGNVAKKTVPKMCLVSPPRTGGSIATRTFIPHRVHESIGVLGAVSIASACVVPGSVPAGMARIERAGGSVRVEIEHPTGSFGVLIEVEGQGATTRVVRAALLRTARKLMSGHVFIPSRIWSGS